MRTMLKHALAAAVLMGGAVVCAAIGERAYFWYVAEDGFCETLTAVLFLGGFVYALRARRALSRNHETLLSYLFLVAVFGMAFLVGEEISWGQRFFHWSTPAALAERNVQGETTLHNIDGMHQMIGFAQLLIGAYGAFLPFLVPRLGAGWLRRVLMAIVPPARFAPYFFPLFAWRLLRLFVELPQENHYAITQINEVLECILAVGLMLFFRHAWLTARAGGAAGTSTGELAEALEAASEPRSTPPVHHGPQ